MESDLPIPIDDSLPFIQNQKKEVSFREEEEDEEEEPRYYYAPQHQQPMYIPQMHAPPPQPQQFQKSGDIFSDLDRIHWIIFFACIVLAFFMGKSISTPIIIRST
jgi:hypothetical protein